MFLPIVQYILTGATTHPDWMAKFLKVLGTKIEP